MKEVIAVTSSVLRRWNNYFRCGSLNRCLQYVRHWVERNLRLIRGRGKSCFDCNRRSRRWLYEHLGCYVDHGILFPPRSFPTRLSYINLDRKLSDRNSVGNLCVAFDATEVANVVWSKHYDAHRGKGEIIANTNFGLNWCECSRSYC